MSTVAEGRISEIDFQVIGEVTGVSPSVGSAAGGTLVTITGRGFSYEVNENPVRIGTGPGAANCSVISSTPTEI